MDIQVGTTLIALEDVWMEDGETQCLTKDCEYIVTTVDTKMFTITSDIGENHFWYIRELNKYFKISEK